MGKLMGTKMEADRDKNGKNRYIAEHIPLSRTTEIGIGYR